MYDEPGDRREPPHSNPKHIHGHHIGMGVGVDMFGDGGKIGLRIRTCDGVCDVIYDSLESFIVDLATPLAQFASLLLDCEVERTGKVDKAKFAAKAAALVATLNPADPKPHKH